MVSNHSKIKTWWQQSRAKCYHLLISWSCHYHPPLKLSRFPVPNDKALCRTWEPLTAFANYSPRGEQEQGKWTSSTSQHTRAVCLRGLAFFQCRARDSPCAQSSPCAGSSIKNHRCEAAGVHTNTHAEACPLLLRWALMSCLDVKWSI